jgi:hypothetical protein
MSHRKKTARPDLSSRQAGQCVLAQGGDYNRTSFLSIRGPISSLNRRQRHQDVLGAQGVTKAFRSIEPSVCERRRALAFCSPLYQCPAK